MSKNKLDIDFFRKESLRLSSHFGSDVCTKERLNLIWAEVKDLTNDQFRELTNFLIGEFSVRFDPKISTIREQVLLLKKKAHARETAIAANNWKTEIEARNTGCTDSGYQNELNRLGANSLLDAILKVRTVK